MSAPRADGTRPFSWSLRREIWENRSIVWGPIIVAVVIVFGYLFTLPHLPERRQAALLLDPVKRQAAIEMIYDAATGMLLVVAFIIGAFYCLDALYGERRERSVLFWKSLPVSDLTVVLSKITVPLVVLPLVCIPLAIALHTIFLVLTSIVLAANGVSPATTFANIHIVQLWGDLICAFPAAVLWHAPIYAWLLLVSAWARRATFLWAVLPAAGVAVFERIAFGTAYVDAFIKYRLFGWFHHAFAARPANIVTEPFSLFTPGKYLSTPGLWLGLLFSAGCLALAVRLRRDRGPV